MIFHLHQFLFRRNLQEERASSGPLIHTYFDA